VPAALLTSAGTPLRLGRELGRGGEGAVYAVAGRDGQVAKVYHRPPDARKQAKLAFMAAHAERALLDYSAWPQETLHAARGGPPIGFLMQAVSRREAIHALYSPAQRRETHPELAWDFLLFVARNTAAAFAALHAHGHVLGDVNQGNVAVGGDSRVVLIDCDSFQVDARGTVHVCEVGVGHFTPPELQGVPSFDQVVRTPNHDNFGLAVLLFHLLLGGRHPYCGVPLAHGVGEALEADIRGFRYAFARDARRRGIAPPPRALPVGMLPPLLVAMFECAFTEPGARGARPTARQWVDALDAVRGGVRRCGRTAMHVHPAHLHACPWCALEREGVVHFLDPRMLHARVDPAAFVAQAWARIEAVAEPPLFGLPHVPARTMLAAPVPPGLGRRHLFAFRLLAVAVVAAMVAASPGGWIFALIAGVFAWSLARSFAEEPWRRERAHRRARLDVARREARALLDAARHDGGRDGFRLQKARLAHTRDRYLRLAREARRLRHHRARFAVRRMALEAELRAGAAALEIYSREASARIARHRPGLEAAARRIAQAERDLAEFD
jgi:DNA-binding helix-hairpin-helix protein with protein kinase domain